MEMLRAGVVGLGQMGGGAAICLARAGRPLTVYDIDPKAALKWEDGHLVPPVAVNCAEVARNSDVVIVLVVRSEEHTSELQSLMRISYAVFCLQKKKLKNLNAYI